MRLTMAAHLLLISLIPAQAQSPDAETGDTQQQAQCATAFMRNSAMVISLNNGFLFNFGPTAMQLRRDSYNGGTLKAAQHVMTDYVDCTQSVSKGSALESGSRPLGRCSDINADEFQMLAYVAIYMTREHWPVGYVASRVDAREFELARLKAKDPALAGINSLEHIRSCIKDAATVLNITIAD